MSLLQPAGAGPQTVDLTPAQVALIVALEPILQATGLSVVCPTCAAANDVSLVTDNGREDATWKIHCACTQRTFPRQALPTMVTSGDLLLHAETILRGARLAVRCIAPWCLTADLTVTPETDGVTVRCQCWQVALGVGIHRFTKHAPRAATAAAVM